jgi:hypothetical protein
MVVMTPEAAKERADFNQAVGRLEDVLSPRSSSSITNNQNFSPFLIVIAMIMLVASTAWGIIIDERAENRIKLLLADQVHREETAATQHETQMALVKMQAQVDAARWESQVATEAANRRADMAQLIALQSQVRDHTDDLKGVRAWLKINGENLAKLEARNAH